MKSSRQSDGPCQECGLDYVRGSRSDERNHKKFHDRVVNGCKTKLPDGCHIVTHRSDIAMQKLAEAAASEALHETKYDHISFYADKKVFDAEKTIAVITVSNGRVCGLVVSRERDCECKAQLQDFKQNHLHFWRPTKADKVQPQKRRALDMIWVLNSNRRQGVARRMVQALAEHCKMKVGDLGHVTPFSEDALRLWQGFKLSTIYLA